MKRIGLYHGPLYRGESGYETYGPYARYVLEFARHFDEVVVFGPVADGDTDYRGCSIEAGNVRVVALPDFRTHVQASRRLPSLFRTFRREIDRVDVINCRHTAPFGYLLYGLARARGIGFFYHFTSDPSETMAVSPRYDGLYGRFARAAYGLDFRIQQWVMRRTFSFVNGRLPCERLRRVTDRVTPILSSALIPSDFRPPAARALHQPVRLLYVGYLKHAKGLDDLLEAVSLLRHRSSDVALHLVGAGPEETALRSRIAALGLDRHVHFHGYVPMGPALNRHYDEADIFVFPSLSEGSPRAVLEALAHSLPVVSTEVGSVPELIEAGVSGLLVPPRNAAALADAVARYIQDHDFRNRCATAGFAAAQHHTVEDYVAPLAAKAAALARKVCNTA